VLTVTGLLCIGGEPNLKKTEVGNGTYLNFYATSESLNKVGDSIYHKYQIDLWVPSDDVQKWEKRIVSGAVFFLSGGKLSAEMREGQKYPMTSIKVSHLEFKPLAKAYWLEKED